MDGEEQDAAWGQGKIYSQIHYWESSYTLRKAGSIKKIYIYKILMQYKLDATYSP